MPDRRPPYDNLGEREQLVAFLDYLRESVVAKTEGLSEEEARRPLVPSGTSLLWLVKHLTMADAYWFHSNFAGEDVEEPPEAPLDTDTVASVVADYRRAWQHSNEIVAAAPDLDQVGKLPHRQGGHLSLRWILVHMLEETARHAGHADIIREQIDGEVGR